MYSTDWRAFGLRACVSAQSAMAVCGGAQKHWIHRTTLASERWAAAAAAVSSAEIVTSPQGVYPAIHTIVAFWKAHRLGRASKSREQLPHAKTSSAGACFDASSMVCSAQTPCSKYGLGLVLLRDAALSFAICVVRVSVPRASTPNVTEAPVLLLHASAAQQQRPASTTSPPRAQHGSASGARNNNMSGNTLLAKHRHHHQQPRTLLPRSATSTKLSMIVSSLQDDANNPIVPLVSRSGAHAGLNTLRAAPAEGNGLSTAFGGKDAAYTAALWAPMTDNRASPTLDASIATRKASGGVTASVLASGSAQSVRRVFKHNIALRDTLLVLARYNERGIGATIKPLGQSRTVVE